MLRVVEFKTEYRTGRDPVDWVLVAPAGPAYEKTRTWHPVSKIRPPEHPEQTLLESASYQDMAAKWSVIGPAYEAWKAGQEVPVDGTPLDAWSGVTKEQAKFLKAMSIRTVEEVRDMGDAAISQLRFPNARQLPKLAKEYLEGADGAAKDAKIAELEERMQAMAEMLEQQAKRGPGRPRKTESEAA